MDRAGGQALGETVLILMLVVIVAVVMAALFGERLSGFFMRVVRAF